MTLGWTEALFLALRLLMAGLCLLGAGLALRRRGQSPAPGGRMRVMLPLGAALLAAGAALALHDAWRNLVILGDVPLDAGSWVWLVFDLGVPLLALVVLGVVRERDAALAQLAAMSETDPLTGIGNRRGFEARALAAIAAAHRAGQGAAVLLLDLDRFKAINDGFGHPIGDAVLRATAETLARTVRSEDVLGRLGGEEFAVLVPRAGKDAAAALGERLRLAVREGVRHPDPGARVTLSAGLALLGEGPPALALNAALAAADQALYAAKRAGRDRLAFAGAPGAGGDDKAPSPMA